MLESPKHYLVTVPGRYDLAVAYISLEHALATEKRYIAEGHTPIIKKTLHAPEEGFGDGYYYVS